MRLKGFFKGDSPFILISVKANKPSIWRQIHFLIDTGSDVTGIASRDLLAMGISYNRLGRPSRSVFGLVDKARRWVVKNAELRFETEDRKLAKFGPMEIYIMETSKECPSLLGRDFLVKYGFKLVCDIPNKKVYLEK